MSEPAGRRVFRGLAAVSGATAVAMAITAGISMVMPLALSLNGYAYWQLFSLYSSYVGFFALGFNDGVYQRLSKEDYDDRVIGELASLKWVVVVLGAVGSLATLASVSLFPHDKRFAVTATACCVLFFGLSGFLTYANQLATRLYVVAASTLVERVSLLFATIALVLAHVHDYRWFVAASVGASLLRLVYLVVLTPRVSFQRRIRRREFGDIIEYFKTGFPLMMAVLMGSTIMVPSRLVVESVMGPEAFALYSFALTVVFIAGAVLSSLAQSVFPLFSRMEQDRLNASVTKAHAGLTAAAAVLLLGYFFAAVVVQIAYPHFAGSLEYMGLLFPLFIFQSKYLILLCTLHRARGRILRMVVVAASGLVANAVSALVLVSLTHSVMAVAAGTVVSYVCWLTPWWIQAIHEQGTAWSSWDTTELVLSGAFLVALLTPRVLGVVGATGLAASCALYLAVLVCLGLAQRRYLGEIALAQVSRARRLVR